MDEQQAWKEIVNCPNCDAGERGFLKVHDALDKGWIWMFCDGCLTREYYGSGGRYRGAYESHENIGAWEKLSRYRDITREIEARFPERYAV